MLEGKFQEKIWGGDRLKTEFGFEIDSPNVGEYWAISAMDQASSVVINGNLAGHSLDEVYKNHKDLFGENPSEKFPLLIKIIDATEDLSIQVHPDDKMAGELENGVGKTECWYVLNEEDASIIYGLEADSKEAATSMIEEARWDELLREVPARKGDFFFVPAGTVHAIKAGCLILEIQQASDITYRLYDYNRPDKDGKLRELHIDKSIEAMKLSEVDNEQTYEEYETYKLTRLTKNNFFEVNKFEITGLSTFEREKPYLLMSVVEGEGTLTVDGESYGIGKGNFFILTSAVTSYQIDGKLTVVEASVEN